MAAWRLKNSCCFLWHFIIFHNWQGDISKFGQNTRQLPKLAIFSLIGHWIFKPILSDMYKGQYLNWVGVWFKNSGLVSYRWTSEDDISMYFDSWIFRPYWIYQAVKVLTHEAWSNMAEPKPVWFGPRANLGRFAYMRLTPRTPPPSGADPEGGGQGYWHPPLRLLGGGGRPLPLSWTYEMGMYTKEPIH